MDFITLKEKLVNNRLNNHLAFFYIEIVLVILVVALFLTNNYRILGIHFMQDEWHNIGMHQIYEVARFGDNGYIKNLFSKTIPVSYLINYINYKLFGVSNFPVSFIVLFISALNIPLLILNLKRITGSFFISILTVLFGYINYASVQVFTWTNPGMYTHISFLLFNISLYYYIDFLSRKNLVKFSLVVIFLLLSVLTKQVTIFIFFTFLFFYLYTQEVTLIIRNKFYIMFTFFLSSGLFLAFTLNNSGSRILGDPMKVFINVIFITFRTFSQTLLPDPTYIYKLLVYLIYNKYEIANNALYVQTIGAELLSIICSLLFLLMFIPLFITNTSKKYKKALVFFLLMYLCSLAPFYFDRYTLSQSFLESRHYFIISFPVFGIFFLGMRLLIEILSSYKNKIVSYLFFFILATINTSVLYWNITLVRKEINLVREYTIKRLEILHYMSNSYDQALKEDFILFIDEDADDDNVGSNRTGKNFQTGLLYPFLVYAYPKSQFSPNFFSDDILWNLNFQGVKVEGEHTIGLFYSYSDLILYLRSATVSLKNIYSISFDYRSMDTNCLNKNPSIGELVCVKYSDNTQELRDKLVSEDIDIR